MKRVLRAVAGRTGKLADGTDLDLSPFEGCAIERTRYVPSKGLIEVKIEVEVDKPRTVVYLTPDVYNQIKVETTSATVKAHNES